MPKRNYTFTQLQEIFKFRSKNTIRNWELKLGFPAHVVIGCRCYWDAEAVDKWHAERLAGGAV